jgi:hypothetical protein
MGMGRNAFGRPERSLAGAGMAGAGMAASGRTNGGHGMAATGNGTASTGGYGGFAREPMAAAPHPSASQAPRAEPSERAYVEPAPFPRPPQRPLARTQLTDLDIPTFIRRQMD